MILFIFVPWSSFFNGNVRKGWGALDEGGLFAILKGQPELSVEDFTLLAYPLLSPRTRSHLQNIFCRLSTDICDSFVIMATY